MGLQGFDMPGDFRVDLLPAVWAFIAEDAEYIPLKAGQATPGIFLFHSRARKQYNTYF